jgi:hypothetical protein
METPVLPGDKFRALLIRATMDLLNYDPDVRIPSKRTETPMHYTRRQVQAYIFLRYEGLPYF